jgi:hypothetical protein
MNQELNVLLIGMLGNYFGGLNNHIQTLLKPMHIRGQADEILEVPLTENAIGDTSADECSDAMFGNLLKRGAPAFSKLLKRTPGRPRYKSQGRRSSQRSGHGATSTQRIAQPQRHSNETVGHMILAESRDHGQNSKVLAGT